MRVVSLAAEDDFDGWRNAARALALEGVPAGEVIWQVGAAADLFAEPEAAAASTGPAFTVARSFIDLARLAIGHDDPERFALLYALLLRCRDDPEVMEKRGDPLLLRVEAMARVVRNRELEPASADAAALLEKLRAEAAHCTRCPLHRHATQTVFGEGPADARLMLVGEEPGDQEDIQGRVFVGPAGRVLDRALDDAGIDRARIYLSNAVKHFKFEPRGKRRIHAKPDTGEIEACRWWIEQEQMLVRPVVTVALGAVAARSLFGRTVTIGRERGREVDLPEGGMGWITVHPSFLLRIDDKMRAAEEYDRFVEDLRQAAALAEAD